jgi:hypothetical protein
MILLRILEHDLHRSRDANSVPLMISTPVPPKSVPAIVSDTRGRFIAIRKMRQEGNFIASGVFEYDSDRVDDVVSDLFDAAYVLSCEDKLGNTFSGKDAPKRAFNYIKRSSGIPGQPHVCLVPESWKETKIKQFFGVKNLENVRKYQKFCRIVSTKVSIPVFCSRPDMVGMYTQFLGGKTSIILHNVKLGLAFVVPTGGS